MREPPSRLPRSYTCLWLLHADLGSVGGPFFLSCNVFIFYFGRGSKFGVPRSQWWPPGLLRCVPRLPTQQCSAPIPDPPACSLHRGFYTKIPPGTGRRPS